MTSLRDLSREAERNVGRWEIVHRILEGVRKMEGE